MRVSAAARPPGRHPAGRTPRMARAEVPGGFSGRPAYMGVDVGKFSHRACALDASGRKLPSKFICELECHINYLIL